MASGFDDLIDRLLYDLALSGSQGVDAQQIEDAVKNFHAQQKVADHTPDGPLDILFSDTPPTRTLEADDSFLNLVLDWLCKHPDVEVKDADPGQDDVSSSAAAQVAETAGDSAATPNWKENLQGKRIYATTHRIWQALTGHGVDYHRVPLKEFECLTAIVAAGPSGIIQPDLTKVTGQDKRSVPKRTDGLAQKGYITKETVVSARSKTSLLTWKKYAKVSPLISPDVSSTPAVNAQSRPIIFYENWYFETMRLLKENGGKISMADLRIGLGIEKQRWETNILIRCIRRCDKGGLLRRFTAVMHSHEGEALRRISTGKDKKVKALELLREPAEMDRILWTQSLPADKSSGGVAKLSSTSLTNDNDAAEANDDGDDVDADDDTNDLDLIKQRVPPRWTPDMPYPNLLFNIIDRAGPAGVSSMHLNKLATGPGWRRSLDEVMGKMTDVWRISQPPHLRHFTLVRDTAVRGKTAHYQYRSLANFRQAIEAGDASWAAVGGDPGDAIHTAAKLRWTELDLDEWGFPKTSSKRFTISDVGATMASTENLSTDVPARKSAVERKARRSRALTHVESPKNVEVLDRAPSPVPKARQERPYKRKITDNPILAKRRLAMEEKERKEFDHIAQGVAVRRVLAEMRRTMPDGTPITIRDLPRDRVQSLKAEVLARNKPGLYINPPGSRAMKQDNFFQRGRPRKCLIAVIRSEKLQQLPWFTLEEEEPYVPSTPASPRPPKRKISSVLDPQLSAATGQDDFTSEATPPQAKKPRNEGGRTLSRLTEHHLLTVESERDPAAATRLVSDELINEQADNQTDPVSQRPAERTSRKSHGHTIMSMEPASLLQTSDNIFDEERHTQPGAADLSTSTHHLKRSFELMAADSPELEIATELGADSNKASSRGGRPPKKPKKEGTLRNGGFIAEQRVNAILGAVRQCNGVFPGNNEIWYVVTTYWKKKFHQTPDKHTIERAIANLLANGSLKKYTFQFRTQKGLMQTRSILAEPGVSPQSPVFRAMQKMVKDTWPDQYLPPEVEVESEMRKQAGNMYGRRKPQDPTDMDKGSGIGAEPKPKMYDKYPMDPRTTVRQTPFSAEVSDAEARAQGFENAQAYRLHCIQVNRNYRRSWGRLGLPEVEEMLESASWDLFPARELRRKSKAWERRAQMGDNHSKLPASWGPLSTLRLNDRGGVRKPRLITQAHARYIPSVAAHSRLNPQWIANVAITKQPMRRPRRKYWDADVESNQDPETALRNRAALLMMKPVQSFSRTNGTFGTLSSILSPDVDLWEQETASSSRLQASSLTNGDHLDAVRPRVVHPNPSTIPSRSRDFYRDVDLIKDWELHMIENGRSVHSAQSASPFIHHVLNRPHVVAPVIPPAPVRAPPFSVLAGPPQPIPLQPTLIPTAGPEFFATVFEDVINPSTGKKQGASKRAKTVRIVEGGFDSSTEVPINPAGQERQQRKTYARRDRQSAAAFKDCDRLVIAYALIAALCGGVNQDRMNWTLIAHAMSFRYEGDFLRRRWAYFRKYRTKDMEKIRDAIRKPFLKAYEKGRLPKIDYQNLEKTAWPTMFQWVEKEVLPTLDGENAPAVPKKLPATRAELEKGYQVVEQSSSYEPKRDDYYTGISDQGRLHKILQFRYGTVLPHPATPSEIADEENILLKSWVRALAGTKQWHFDASRASHKLRPFPEAQIQAVSKAMVGAKILTREKRGRQPSGRPYHIHNDFLLQFRRWPGRHEEHRFLHHLAAARAGIVAHFAVHPDLELVPTADDPSYLVLTNMVASGLLTLRARLPARNDAFDAPFPKLSPWTYAGYSYETKKVPIAGLKFPIVYTRSPSFTPDHGLRTGVPVPLGPPAVVPGEPGLRIPFWVDVHGNLMGDVWELVMRSVIHLLVFRPGSDVRAMEAAHKGKFGAWEIEILLDWMEKVGIAVRCGHGWEEGGVWKGSWRAGADWYCAFCPEVVTWNDVVGSA